MSRKSPRSGYRLLLVLALVVLVVAACGGGEHSQNTLAPKGPEARTVDSLWDFTFPIAVAIFFLVQGLVVLIMWKFRARSDDDSPKQVHGNAKAEIGWTIAPAALLAAVGVFTVITVFDINEQAEGSDVVNVKVVGHQWWWEYEYTDLDIVTANELHIPVQRTVQLELTAADVIHSFWPPALAGKVDTVPGRTNHMKIEADEPGRYPGQCAEYCGLSHANMRLVVVAHSAEDFEDWVENQQRDAETPVRTETTTTVAGDEAAAEPIDALTGSELFITRGCSGCHTVRGLEGAAGKIGPDLTHFASRKVFAGAIFETDDKNLRKWLRNPPAEKPMMPANGQGMPNLGLSEDDITSLIAYLETLT
ncbi:MAG TPA: cytochrome c oxidase subunit II [Acidimicrobiales bacterium]|nr:cytochrome c oxidase subunit II [Acidimicrobiales bacterium]